MSLSIFCCVCSGAAFRPVTASARYSAPVFAVRVSDALLNSPFCAVPSVRPAGVGL